MFTSQYQPNQSYKVQKLLEGIFCMAPKGWKRCVVGTQTEQMLNLGHPWILRDRFTDQWHPGESGEGIALHGTDGTLLGFACVMMTAELWRGLLRGLLPPERPGLMKSGFMRAWKRRLSCVMPM